MMTNFIYAIIGLALLTSRLLNDFQKDKGQNKKAKIFQAACMGLIVASYANSIRYVGWLFRHYDKAEEKFTVDVGIIPGHIHFKVFLLNIVLMVSALVIAFFVASRHQKARHLLFYILPFLALTEMFNFYRGWLSDGDDLGVNHSFIFMIAFVIIGGITVSILLIYNSKTMRDFFSFTVSTPDTEKIENQTQGDK